MFFFNSWDFIPRPPPPLWQRAVENSCEHGFRYPARLHNTYTVVSRGWVSMLSSDYIACQSACQPVCLLVCPSVCLSACPFCLSACLSACLPVCLLVCLSVCLSACLSACLSVCLLVCLPVCPPVLSKHYLFIFRKCIQTNCDFFKNVQYMNDRVQTGRK